MKTHKGLSHPGGKKFEKMIKAVDDKLDDGVSNMLNKLYNQCITCLMFNPGLNEEDIDSSSDEGNYGEPEHEVEQNITNDNPQERRLEENETLEKTQGNKPGTFGPKQYGIGPEENKAVDPDKHGAVAVVLDPKAIPKRGDWTVYKPKVQEEELYYQAQGYEREGIIRWHVDDATIAGSMKMWLRSP